MLKAATLRLTYRRRGGRVERVNYIQIHPDCQTESLGGIMTACRLKLQRSGMFIENEIPLDSFKLRRSGTRPWHYAAPTELRWVYKNGDYTHSAPLELENGHLRLLFIYRKNLTAKLILRQKHVNRLSEFHLEDHILGCLIPVKLVIPVGKLLKYLYGMEFHPILAMARAGLSLMLT